MYKEIEEFAIRAIGVCKKKGWKRDWSSGGCYLHLESSEFIEALRGKGEPYEEAADLLFVFLSILRHHEMKFKDVIQQLDKFLKQMETENGNSG